jgi:hypothetical protein
MRYTPSNKVQLSIISGTRLQHFAVLTFKKILTWRLAASNVMHINDCSEWLVVVAMAVVALS